MFFLYVSLFREMVSSWWLCCILYTCLLKRGWMILASSLFPSISSLFVSEWVAGTGINHQPCRMLGSIDHHCIPNRSRFIDWLIDRLRCNLHPPQAQAAGWKELCLPRQGLDKDVVQRGGTLQQLHCQADAFLPLVLKDTFITKYSVKPETGWSGAKTTPTPALKVHLYV